MTDAEAGDAIAGARIAAARRVRSLRPAPGGCSAGLAGLAGLVPAGAGVEGRGRIGRRRVGGGQRHRSGGGVGGGQSGPFGGLRRRRAVIGRRAGRPAPRGRACADGSGRAGWSGPRAPAPSRGVSARRQRGLAGGGGPAHRHRLRRRTARSLAAGPLERVGTMRRAVAPGRRRRSPGLSAARVPVLPGVRRQCRHGGDWALTACGGGETDSGWRPGLRGQRRGLAKTSARCQRRPSPRERGPASGPGTVRWGVDPVRPRGGRGGAPGCSPGCVAGGPLAVSGTTGG
jgi:hypothetical protein